MSQELIIKIWSAEKTDDVFSVPRISDHEFLADERRECSREEIPADILLTVPGVCYLTVLRMAPYVPGEDEGARGYALKFAKKTAGTISGAVEELLPDGKRTVSREKTGEFSYPALNEYTAKSRLNVWYDPKKDFTAIADGVVSVFEKYLPYALPSAYGTSLSPENVCGEGDFDREKFVDFLKNTPAPVWFAKSPVIAVFVRDPVRREAQREGYRAGCLSVEFPSALTDIAEWNFALRRTLCELCAACGAFFGQITDADGGVASWWWQGIPDELGSACVIGEPYFSLIPDCTGKNAKIFGGESKLAYFEEPYGPVVDAELLSFKRKRIISRKKSFTSADDFIPAKKIPLIPKNDE